MTLLIEPHTSGKFIPAEWQIEDLSYLSELEESANWSEMGAYKTSTVLWLAKSKVEGELKPEFPCIMIVTTPSGKGTYYEAVPEILPEYTLIDVTTTGAFLIDENQNRVKIDDRLPDDIQVPHVVLTHYQVFMRVAKGEPLRDKQTKKVLRNPVTGAVMMAPWTQADWLLDRDNIHFIGLDEAHRIKNRQTKWTSNVKKLRAPFKHVMTGTGFINRPDEIWSLLNFLNRGEYSSYWRFRDTYCDIDYDSGFARVVGIKPDKKDEFRQLVRTVGVRRTLDEVMPHIKKPIFMRRDVELNATQRRMFEEIKRELKMMDQKGEHILAPNVLAGLNRARQVCVATPELADEYFDEKLGRKVTKIKLVEPSSKLDEAMEIINELQWDDDERQQVVIFSCFKDPLELLKVRLDNADIPYIHMRESDNDRERYHKWFEQFPQKEHKVFMSTLQLGSESINLTSARHVIFLDRSWSPKDNQQGVGRVRRPGQEGQPVVINIEAIDTTDQRLEDLNNLKTGWFREIFGDDDD